MGGLDVGRVYALDAQTGGIIWRAALGGEVKGTPAGRSSDPSIDLFYSRISKETALE